MAQAPLSFQRLIETDVRSKKIFTHWREPENPIRWAYAKLMRERDKTRRVYDVDPYKEVYTLRDGIYGIYAESIGGGGDAWIFLIEGPERALLIDTGFGLGDLKGLVHELIGDKPYDVVNTHFHRDHAGGNYQFDRVYCHIYDVNDLQAAMMPTVFDQYFDENGRGIWSEFDKNDLVKFREYEIVGVEDGYTFDLGGGHEVELLFMGGHSLGHSGLLDKKHRIFFPGDDCCVGAIGIGSRPEGTPYREFGTVECFAGQLEKIIARSHEFDSLFPSHGPVETGPVMLQSALEACRAVLANPGDYDNITVNERGTQYQKMIFESGYLNYTPQSVYMGRDAEME